MSTHLDKFSVMIIIFHRKQFNSIKNKCRSLYFKFSNVIHCMSCFFKYERIYCLLPFHLYSKCSLCIFYNLLLPMSQSSLKLVYVNIAFTFRALNFKIYLKKSINLGKGMVQIVISQPREYSFEPYLGHGVLTVFLMFTNQYWLGQQADSKLINRLI